MHIQFTFSPQFIVPKWFQADLTELGKNSNSAVPLDKSRSTYDLPWNTNDDLFKIHINPTIPKIPQPVPQVLISQYCAIFTLNIKANKVTFSRQNRDKNVTQIFSLKTL